MDKGLSQQTRWARVAALLDQAFELPSAERRSWLDRACGGDRELRAEVEALLAADEAADGLFTTGQPFGDDGGIAARISALGSRVGPYELIKPLAQGGMGQVFLARRVDGEFDQQVAIKFLSLQLDTGAQRHFQAECQNLARLDHPNVVHLLDAGIADNGISYLVLQYVDGQVLEQWSQRSGAGLRSRMQLFIQLCDAVTHAHRHLIVHRDIKPSNVLVTADNNAKLLDFGISRDLGDERTATSSLLTPRFAAPEQILGQPFTIGTDIYGLGVLLHLLLTGQPPYADDDASLEALAARAKRDEPPRPSSLAAVTNQPVARKRLRGDLDAMVLKCLQTDPAHRYESAALLRDDVQAWLDGREISARRPGLWRRLLGVIRRHRWFTVGAATLLTIAVGASTYHLRTVGAERDAAVATTDFLVNLMSEIDPYQRSADDAMVMPLSEFYSTGLDALEQSEVPTEERIKLALAFSSGLDSVDAEEQALIAAERAVAWAEQHEPMSASHVRSVQQRANVLTNLNRYERAKQDFSWLTERIGQQIPADSHWAATVYQNYGASLLGAGDVAESLVPLAMARAILEELTGRGEARATLLGVLMSQSASLSRLQRYDEARAASDRQVELARHWFGENHIQYVRAVGQSVVTYRFGHPDAELDRAREAFHASRRVLGSDNSETLSMHNNYALKLWRMEHFDEAVEQFKQVISISKEAGQLPSTSYQNLASLLNTIGRTDEAWQYTERAKQAYVESLGEQHWRVAMPLITQTNMALSAGRPDEAFELAQQAIALTRDALGFDHYATGAARGMAIAAKADLGQCAPKDLLLPPVVRKQIIEQLEQNRQVEIVGHIERGKDAEPCR